MIVLNVTVSGVTYQLFLHSLHAFVIEFLILSRDLSMIILAVTLLDLLLYLLLRKWRTLLKGAKYFLLAVNVCMFVVDLFALYNFKFPFNSLMLDIVMMTNVREGGEFIQTYLLKPGLWLFFCAIGLGLYAFRFVFMMVSRRKLVLFVLLLLGSCAGVFAVHRDHRVARNESRFTNSVGISRLLFMLNKDYQVRRSYNMMLEKVPQKITLTRNNAAIPYVVFILGESTTRNHLGIYGGKVPNTPCMIERQKEGNLYVFDDVISPHGSTTLVLQKLFTFCRYQSSGKWYEYTDLFRILKAAGYRTVWLSNQEKTIGGQVVSYYTHHCDVNKFTDNLKETMKRSTNYDEELLPLLDEALKHDSAKNFYVIHLLGTHYHYHKRFPPKFAVFSSNEEGLSSAQNAIRANYYNAVLYNDFIINESIKRFEDKNAIVIYVSDHGQEVYDTMNYEGHADGLKSRFVIEVPMIIWCSQKFSDSYPELVKRIAASVHRPYMTDDMIHTVLDIMDIETEEYVPSRSVINPDFDSSRQRIYAKWLYTKEGGLSEIH